MSLSTAHRQAHSSCILSISRLGTAPQRIAALRSIAARARNQQRQQRAAVVSATPAAASSVAAGAAPAPGQMAFHYTELKFQTKPGIDIIDITPQIRAEVERLGVSEGTCGTWPGLALVSCGLC